MALKISTEEFIGGIDHILKRDQALLVARYLHEYFTDGLQFDDNPMTVKRSRENNFDRVGRTATRRWAAANPQLQNIPRHKTTCQNCDGTGLAE